MKKESEVIGMREQYKRSVALLEREREEERVRKAKLAWGEGQEAVALHASRLRMINFVSCGFGAVALAAYIGHMAGVIDAFSAQCIFLLGCLLATLGRAKMLDWAEGSLPVWRTEEHSGRCFAVLKRAGAGAQLLSTVMRSRGAVARRDLWAAEMADQVKADRKVA